MEQPLRLERHHPRAGADQRQRAVAHMRADVEGKIAGGDDAPVELGQPRDPPGPGAVDDERARKPDPAAEGRPLTRARSSQATSTANDQTSAANAAAARIAESGGASGGARMSGEDRDLQHADRAAAAGRRQRAGERRRRASRRATKT